jgi:prepilin-type N-terminal cleavage/methylation domain-containing protein
MKARVMKAIGLRREPSFCERRGAFTIVEVMISIFIFAIIITAIYSIWMGIMRGMEAVKTATASVQRSRIAIRTLEDAFITSEMFLGDINHYWFEANTDGDMAAVSMISRLPASFPGVGRYGDQVVRRVSFYVTNSPSGGNDLVMTQMPMLLDVSSGYAYTLTLARDVTLFKLEFYDLQKNEWQEKWNFTNRLPKLVQIAIGLGKRKGHSSDPQDVVTRLVALPANAVGGDIQGAGPGLDQRTNRVPGQPPLGPGQQPIGPGGGGFPPGGYQQQPGFPAKNPGGFGR